MKILRGIGRIFKPLVNFPRWMDWRSVSKTAGDISQTAKGLFIPQQAKRRETFEEAVKRLDLTEQDLQKRMKSLKLMLIVYSLIAAGLFSYAVYLMLNGRLAAALLSLVLTLLALAFAFREHFWYFQIKNRHLGYTVKEWLSAIFRRAQK